MRLYLAGASAELQLIEGYIKRILAETSHTITHDWTKAVRRYGANPPNMLLPDRKLASIEDLSGAFQADLVWLLVPAAASIGCYFEVGAAFQDGKQIIASGDTRKSIFCSLFKAEYPTHEDAFKVIRAMRVTP